MDYYGEASRPQIAPVTPVYDPGALLSAVAAVLSAEGLPVNAALALSACAQLLTWQGIGLAPGVPAPTVHLARAYSNRCELLERLQEVLGKVERTPREARHHTNS